MKLFSYPGSLTQTWMNLIPGDYTVTEGPLGAEWIVTVPAGPIGVSAGTMAYADVYNDYDPGSLEVTKHVDLMGAIGDPFVPDFEITITGPSYPSGDMKLFSYPGSLTQTWMNLIPGDYTVTEGPLGTEWIVTVPAGPIGVSAGTMAYADVYNDYNPGALEITKVFVDGTSLDLPSSIFVSITGPSYPVITAVEVPIDPLTGIGKLTLYGLIPGQYDITELSFEGSESWASSINESPVTVSIGETTPATVTITNTRSYTDNTAWGYLPDYAETFDTIDSKLSNWGWTNGLITESGTYVLDLYAGAGGNDLSAGINVGTVTLIYNKELGTAEVTYRTDSSENPQEFNYLMLDAHLWIENEPLPMLKNNKYTTSPGQFPDDSWYVSHDDYTYVYSISGLGGDGIYIATHAVVRVFD
jgi:hypothetical protein